eukprot:5471198-Pyramimonas_sp.AAC.1
MSETTIDVDLLPQVVGHIVGIPFAASDMDDVYMRLQPELQIAAAPKRRRIARDAPQGAGLPGPMPGHATPPAV